METWNHCAATGLRFCHRSTGVFRLKKHNPLATATVPFRPAYGAGVPHVLPKIPERQPETEDASP